MSPSYNFFCRSCETEIEETYSIGKFPKAIVCPNCGNVADKVLTPVTFHLGEGSWARNRYSGQSNIKWRGIKDD